MPLVTERIRVLNLQSQSDRWRDFVATNSHLAGYVRHEAIDGQALSRQFLIQNGFLTEQNGYNAGALGCAVSHARLWYETSQSGQAMTVIEDDAVLHPDFAARAQALADRIGEWDVILWGWNLDWPALVGMAPGLPPMVLRSDSETPAYAADAYRGGDAACVAMQVHCMAGTLAYTVSAAGADRLLKACLPIGNATPPVAGRPGFIWANGGIDVEMSRHYSSLRAFCAVPPLAFSPNDWDGSGIRTAGQAVA